jgi:hypothetical protein
MCNPMAMMAGSASSSVVSSIYQGQISKIQGDMQGQQMDYAARVAKDDALAQATMIRKQQRYAIGAADTAAAASGVVVGEGSAGEANRQIYQDTEHDAYMAIINGDRRAGALQTEGNMARMAGGNAEKNGYLKGMTTALSAGYEASKWPTANKASTIPKAGN